MTDKPELKLVGEDGNAFSILGRATGVARRAGWDETKIKSVMDEAMSSDYDHLLQVMMKNFETD